jgi:hypothetical protein
MPRDLRFLRARRDRSCPPTTGDSRCRADPARTGATAIMAGSGFVRSWTPAALWSSAVGDRIGRPGTARPIQASTHTDRYFQRCGQRRSYCSATSSSPSFACPLASAQFHRRPGGADHEHVVPHGLVVDVDPEHRIRAQVAACFSISASASLTPEASSF